MAGFWCFMVLNTSRRFCSVFIGVALGLLAFDVFWWVAYFDEEFFDFFAVVALEHD